MKNGPHDLYNANFIDFISAKHEEVLGTLISNYQGTTDPTTITAWEGEISVMQEALRPWAHENGHIVFEYDIPRLGKRIDVVLLFRSMVFCLEFKVGKKDMEQMDIEQVLDYALDLKNFHLLSAVRTIVPILIPTRYPRQSQTFMPSVYDDDIFNPLVTGEESLQNLLQQVIDHQHALADEEDFGQRWIVSPYAPTPTIVEAARALYEHHNVDNITRHEADKVSTDATIAYILDVIKKSKEHGEKSICFVTGVPGAGKTLVGLDVAVKQTYQDGDRPVEDEGAVYLSGNGPLVAVLTEALARDNYASCNARGEKKKLSDSRREVRKFIQIIHRYRDNMLAKIKNPVVDGKLEIDPERALKLEKAGYGEVEHVAIFDEAQRSWTRKRLANYLKRGGTYGKQVEGAQLPNVGSSVPHLVIGPARRLGYHCLPCRGWTGN